MNGRLEDRTWKIQLDTKHLEAVGVLMTMEKSTESFI